MSAQVAEEVRRNRLTRLNFSRPPSVSSIVLIHCWALEYLLLRASLKGESQGSSLTTPTKLVRQSLTRQRGMSDIPVPSLGMSSAVWPAMVLSEFWLMGSMIGSSGSDNGLGKILSRQEVYTGKERKGRRSSQSQGFDAAK
jgi:hypothetical protein